MNIQTYHQPPLARTRVSEPGPRAVDRYIARRIRQRREDLRITQTAAGHAIGVSFQQFQKYELGLNRVSASRLYDIAKVLRVTFGWFVEGFERG